LSSSMATTLGFSSSCLDRGVIMSDKPNLAQAPRSPFDPLHVTLQDVARLAGVSIKTVSRVVNHQGEISEKTRQRVQAAIDQLGYRPNFLARSLVRQRTNTLAVVAWGIEYYGPSRALVGVEERAHQLGYSLLLSLLNQPNEYDRERVLGPLLALRVEGIIWAVPGVGDNHAWLSQGQLAHLPSIVFLSTAVQPGVAVVAVDNQSGARYAMQHLIDQGRRKIGIIKGPMDWWEARERHLGWKNTLEQSGLTSSQSLVVESNWSAAGGEQAMRQLLMQEPDIDAVFASSDQIALGALGVIHESGRRVPQDLAIAGFDDIPESAFYWPPLTTVHQHLTEVGRIAVQHLHEMIETRRGAIQTDEPDPTFIEPELVVRASTMQR
jgi:LacI family transcriptional regulator